MKYIFSNVLNKILKEVIFNLEGILNNCLEGLLGTVELEIVSIKKDLLRRPFFGGYKNYFKTRLRKK